jgi:hypothetical protein
MRIVSFKGAHLERDIIESMEKLGVCPEFGWRRCLKASASSVMDGMAVRIAGPPGYLANSRAL